MSASVSGLSRALPWLAAAGVLSALSVHLIEQGRAWFELAQEAHNVAPQASQNTAQTQPITPLLALFKGPQSSAAASTASTLPIRLQASFVSPNSEQSRAVLYIEGGKPQRYAVGDQIQNGLFLQAIFRDHVELKNQGRTENLGFPHLRTAHNTGAANSELSLTPEQQAEQLEQQRSDNLSQLREQMERLRQQMQGSAAD